MSHTVRIEAIYAGNADSIFASALRFSEMTDAMAGLATYDGLPENDTAQEGETLTVVVTFWRFLKMPPHVMHIQTLDRERRTLQSREHSAGIRRWDHRLTVELAGDQAIWTDSVVIDAGWRSPFVARFAAWMYARRHRNRGALAISRTVAAD